MSLETISQEEAPNKKAHKDFLKGIKGTTLAGTLGFAVGSAVELSINGLSSGVLFTGSSFGATAALVTYIRTLSKTFNKNVRQGALLAATPIVIFAGALNVARQQGLLHEQEGLRAEFERTGKTIILECPNSGTANKVELERDKNTANVVTVRYPDSCRQK